MSPVRQVQVYESMRRLFARIGDFHWKFIVAAVLIQGFYWFGLSPFLFSSPQLESLEVQNVSYVRVASPDFERAQQSEHAPAQFPIFECCTPMHVSAKFNVELGAVPEQGLGMIKRMSLDNFTLHVNSALIVAEGAMELERHTYHGQKTRLIQIPNSVLREGANEFHIVTTRSGNPYTDIYSPIIAPYELLRANASRRLWVMNDYRLVITSILLMIFGFGLMLLTHSTHILFATWLCILSLAGIGSSVLPFMTVWPIGSTGRLIVWHAIHFALPVALFGLIDSWTEHPSLKLEFLVIGVGAAAFLATAIALVMGQAPDGYDLGDKLVQWISLAIGVLTLIRIAFHVFAHRDNRDIELAVVSLIAVALGADAWAEITTQKSAGNLDAATPVLLVGLSLAFLSRNFHLFRSAGEMNAALTHDLQERSHELDRAYENQRNLLKQQAHQEERQRIISDMHDGIGSELMALLVATKRGKSDPDWVAEGLQSVIDEMRLMMDSMDSVGESFRAALVTFKDRLTSKVERAGLMLSWHGDFDQLPDLEGRDALNVFRILQEATANAIKHADATEIRVEFSNTSEPVQGMRLAIADNGKGMPDEPVCGRGQSSIQSRAQNLGGELDIQSSERGTTVVLFVPLNPDEVVS